MPGSPTLDPKQIHELLADDYIVIVAGFQGQTPEGETTTLGRGGSDLTAIALAGALNADSCQIFTDVDGVFTCDPELLKTRKNSGKLLMTSCLRWPVAAPKSDAPFSRGDVARRVHSSPRKRCGSRRCL